MAAQFYNATSFNARFEFPSASTGLTQNYYYSFDYGLVHYVSYCVENYLAPWDVGTPQYNWMRQVTPVPVGCRVTAQLTRESGMQDLARAVANRANVPWIIVSGHRPFYGSSNSGSWEGQRRGT
jgi:acid phosphatase type 7